MNIKNPKPEMAAWSIKTWCEGTGNAGSRIDQYLGRNGKFIYHAYHREDGRLDWKLISPEKAQFMRKVASKGGWAGAEYCRALLAHAEMLRQGTETFEGY